MEDLNSLKKGDVFILQCIGDSASYNFLNGSTSGTGYGKVDLAEGYMSEKLSGTLWQVEDRHKDESNEYLYKFRCLDSKIGKKRFLNGIIDQKQVNIVESIESPYTGTNWKLVRHSSHYRLDNQGEGYYLNGHMRSTDNDFKNVDLVSTADFTKNPAQYTGIKWQITKLSDISFGKQNFINPIVNEGHDPWVIKKDNVYYYCFVKNNKIMISRSESLLNIGKVIPIHIVIPDEEKYQNIWAPELHFIKDVWYVIFASGKTLSDENNKYAKHRIRVISCSKPMGVYSAPFTLTTTHYAMDGTFLVRNNEWFLIWSGQPEGRNNKQVLYISRVVLTHDSINLSDIPVEISEPHYDWEKKGAQSADGKVHELPEVNEGPQVLYAPNNPNKIHIIFSASGSWTNDYCLGRLTFTGTTNEDLLKPDYWKKHDEPVFKSGSGITGPYGPGHCSFVTDHRDNHWIVYHCARYSDSKWLRWVQTQRFTWEHETPEFGQAIPRLIPRLIPL